MNSLSDKYKILSFRTDRNEFLGRLHQMWFAFLGSADLIGFYQFVSIRCGRRKWTRWQWRQRRRHQFSRLLWSVSRTIELNDCATNFQRIVTQITEQREHRQFTNHRAGQSKRILNTLQIDHHFDLFSFASVIFMIAFSICLRFLWTFSLALIKNGKRKRSNTEWDENEKINWR